jgi:hypothetical protein
MPNLPDCWHYMTGPTREDIDIFVGSVGGARWDVFQVQDDASTAVDLTGMTLSAELRTLDDQLLAVMDAEITAPLTGWCRVSVTADAAAALPGVSWRRVGTDPKVKIGRYAYFITDDSGRWCMKAGDAYGVRK